MPDLPPAGGSFAALDVVLALLALFLTQSRVGSVDGDGEVCEDDRMAFRDLRRRLTASADELHHDQLRARWSGHPASAIDEITERTRVCVGGEVQGVQVVPRPGSPSLEVRVHDGTGRVVAVFTGRRSIGGMAPGRRVLLEGFAQADGNRLVLMNPEYTLLV